MDIKNNIKSGISMLGDTVSELTSSIVEKNRLRARINRLKQIIKGDSHLRDDAFIALGRYYYDNMRDSANEENEELCKTIDKTTLRIEKASLKCVELLNEQNEIKIKSENAEKIKEILAKKAVDAKDAAANKAKDIKDKAVVKAKETTSDLTQKAKDLASDVKDKAIEFKNKAENKVGDITLDIEEKADDVASVVEDTFDTDEALQQERENLEQLIAMEQEKLRNAEVSAVSESAQAEEKAEESPEEFSF